MLEEYQKLILTYPDTETLVSKHKEDIESRLKVRFGKFEVLNIKTTLLAGIEHEILIKNDKGNVIKVFIYESLPHCRYHTNLCHAMLVEKY